VSISAALPEDLTAARAAVVEGRLSARALLDLALTQADVSRHVFLRRFDAAATAAASAADARRDARAPLPPLAGLPVSIKDLFDVAGAPTTAGSRALAGAAPARADASAVARLRAAGAALIGHTNLTEFAFSGVGINPHHGTPVNPVTMAVDGIERIPGGSTSGGAVSVAIGAAYAALGSDTGGSIRIPAALQGLVGFKCTQRLVPLAGCIPLARSLDTACAITRSVRDAVLMHELLAARTVRVVQRGARSLRLAVPRTLMLDQLDDTVARVFGAALSALSAAGARVDEIDLPPLAELAALNAKAGFAAPESWAAHRRLLEHHGDLFDPRVAVRIRRGESISVADYLDLIDARRGWIASMRSLLAGFDAMLSPTVPMIAPELAPLLTSDDAFFAANQRLLRNPSAVNFLDGCAISIPCHEPGTMPVGLMLWGPALADDAVLGAALAAERALAEA
jgi:amidase/aspartyl-tRNA(Asn)/glutamyl-tRNA(Gln) amidotransferase subunit A